MATWCDKLGSTPTVGLRLDTHFVTTDALLTTFQPLLNRTVVDGKPKFNLDKTNQFSMAFTTNEGFQYSADSSRLAVVFKHNLKAIVGDDGRPVTELTSIVKPFSDLLPLTAGKLTEAVFTLAQLRKRTFNRVGVVSTTLLKPSEAPPGIKAYIDYMGRPWGATAPFYTISLTSQVGADLSASNLYQDRCTQIVARPEEQDQDLLTIVLDYQRSYTTPRTLSRTILAKSLQEVQSVALDYFEQVAIGAIFDEQIINGRTRARQHNTEQNRRTAIVSGASASETSPETSDG